MLRSFERMMLRRLKSERNERGEPYPGHHKLGNQSINQSAWTAWWYCSICISIVWKIRSTHDIRVSSFACPLRFQLDGGASWQSLISLSRHLQASNQTFRFSLDMDLLYNKALVPSSPVSYRSRSAASQVPPYKHCGGLWTKTKPNYPKER